MKDNPELNLAWTIVEKTDANLFLTGKAGTGKTTFLRRLREKSPKRMVVLAPTGIAAINAGGTTIHSFFQLPLSPFVPGATVATRDKRYQFSKVKRNIIRTLDLLVIDEISMVRADLLDAVDEVMRRYRDRSRPFGGVQLLMIGDLQQLAPVVHDGDLQLLSGHYATPYFFSSKALNEARYLTLELQRVYRQQDENFLAILNQIRENKATDATLALLNKRYIPDFEPSADSDYIYLTTHNAPAQRINEQRLQSLPAREYHFDAEVEGEFPETSFPTEARLTVKKGAQVMFVKNDPEHRFYNGMIGEVVSVGDDGLRVRPKGGSEETFVLERAEWTNAKYTLDSETNEISEKVEGVFRQYPIRLAWAITIHKSQGLTFEHAVIDVSHSFAHGQTYVALSRCKTLEGMVLSQPLSHAAIISDQTIDQYSAATLSARPDSATVSSLQTAYVVRLVDELFDFVPIRTAFVQLNRMIQEHFYRKNKELSDNFARVEPLFADIIAVADKFHAQYAPLILNHGSADSPLIQERIHKAAVYFGQQLAPFVDLAEHTHITTDNKTIKKLLDDRVALFVQNVTLKQRLFDYEADPDVAFSTADYLKQKATFLLKDSGDEPTTKKGKKAKKKKAEKAPAEPRIPTAQISFDLFKSGLSIKQIAEQRSLVESTVANHLSQYVATGQIPVDELVPPDHRKAILAFLRENPGVEYVNQVKKALPNDIPYGDIYLVMADFKRDSAD